MSHACPLCRAPGVPYNLATCPRCWRAVPARLQLRLVAAWARRVADPGEHNEALAELLLWARERRSVTGA